MKGYLYTLLVTAVCGGFCSVFAQSGYEKYIKYVASVICVAVMITPLHKSNILDFTKYDYSQYDFSIAGIEKYENTLKLTEANAEEYISQSVFEEWGIKPSYTDIKIDWDKEPPILLGITVAVMKKDEANLLKIKDYLIKTFGQEVEVIAV